MKSRKDGAVAPAQLCSTVLGHHVVYHKKTLAVTSRKRLRDTHDIAQSAPVQSALHTAQEQLDTALFDAVTQKRIPLIARLLSQGAFINALRGGLSPLHTAVMNQDLGVIACLLSHGADVNISGPYGNTPLHQAGLKCTATMLKIMEVLIVAGADVNAQNDLGQTALHFHQRNSTAQYDKMARLLIRAGAQLHLVDIKGNEPFDRLPKEVKDELVRYSLTCLFER